MVFMGSDSSEPSSRLTAIAVIISRGQMICQWLFPPNKVVQLLHCSTYYGKVLLSFDKLYINVLYSDRVRHSLSLYGNKCKIHYL